MFDVGTDFVLVSGVDCADYAACESFKVQKVSCQLLEPPSAIPVDGGPAIAYFDSFACFSGDNITLNR